MKLATLETAQGARVVGVTEEALSARFVDLAAADASFPRTMVEWLALDNGLERAKSAFQTGLKEGLFAEGRLLAPIPSPGKVICIGLNYRDHAVESGADIPSEPVCFSKFSSAVIGPEANIELPPTSSQVDYEAELVVVIGKPGRDIPLEKAQGHVAGYMNGHDVSARDWQLGRPGGQWLLGKTPDTFAPMGPYLVTADEVPEPESLRVALRLNGQTLQDSNTNQLIFGIDRLICHLSALVTLSPGDVIFTGTPPGVGMARKPPVFLKPGDVVEVEIEGLGVLRNPVVGRPG
jgi:2-keto-4-pentenoate hydratase/2-oxohepta-3-ene-1,7-dioic acid hydratase in catechol pathway